MYPFYHGKYLGAHLNWATHVNELCLKVVKTNAMLSKICNFVNETTLWSIYFAIFSSHLSYAWTTWGQFIVPSNRVCILQRNAPRVICFAKFNDHTKQWFYKMKIIKFIDLLSVENCIFINKCFSYKSISVFSCKSISLHS